MASPVCKKRVAGWRDEPIPWGMALRGFLPCWLGGKSVYLAVIRTSHFSTTELLVDYLLRQYLIASARSEIKHADAILNILQSLRKKTSA